MRKTLKIVIDADGRDNGKAFLLTEMAASKAEKWAARAFFALSRSGIDIPEDIEKAGMAGIATLGLKALGGIHDDDAIRLMDEMFECVQFQPADARVPARDLLEDDIEEVATRLKLRMDILELHTGFSLAAALSKQTSVTTLAA